MSCYSKGNIRSRTLRIQKTLEPEINKGKSSRILSQFLSNKFQTCTFFLKIVSKMQTSFRDIIHETSQNELRETPTLRNEELELHLNIHVTICNNIVELEKLDSIPTLF